MKRKLYLTVLTDLGSKTLVMLDIRVMAKLSGVTHQIEPDRSGGKRKASPERHDLTG